MKKIIITIITIVCFLAIGIGVAMFRYFSSTHNLQVIYTDVHSVILVGDTDGKRYPIKHTGQKIRIANSQTYTISYEGNKDYSSGNQTVAKSQLIATIRPDYSEAKNLDLIAQQTPEIQQALTSAYPSNASFYTMNQGQMIDRGTWYVTTLDLVNPDEFAGNENSLRVVFQHQSGKWTVATQPDILLTTQQFPDIPSNILEIANNLPVKQIDLTRDF